MSLNTAHASNGVLLHTGEYILLHCKNVICQFFGQKSKIFEGDKYGPIYLTSHRIIFNNKRSGDLLQSFSIPFPALTRLEVAQPVLRANYLKCRIKNQPHGNFEGKVTLKIVFRQGGAIEYAAALKRAIKLARKNSDWNVWNTENLLPAYETVEGWAEASFPAYECPLGYYEWLPKHDSFTEVPPNVVFMNLSPAPFPGIGAPPPYEPAEEPVPVPTCTPCARYETLSSAPAANGFRKPEDLNKINKKCDNTNIWETMQ